MTNWRWIPVHCCTIYYCIKNSEFIVTISGPQTPEFLHRSCFGLSVYPVLLWTSVTWHKGITNHKPGGSLLRSEAHKHIINLQNVTSERSSCFLLSGCFQFPNVRYLFPTLSTVCFVKHVAGTARRKHVRLSLKQWKGWNSFGLGFYTSFICFISLDM